MLEQNSVLKKIFFKKKKTYSKRNKSNGDLRTSPQVVNPTTYEKKSLKDSLAQNNKGMFVQFQVIKWGQTSAQAELCNFG